MATPQPPEKGHAFTLMLGDADTDIDTTGNAVTRYEAYTADEGTLTYADGPADAHPELADLGYRVIHTFQGHAPHRLWERVPNEP